MRLPVLKAIGVTFAFIGAHIVDILKIIWLPVVLMFGVMVLVMPGYVKASAAMGAMGPETSPEEMNAKLMAFLPQVGLFTLVLLAFNLVIICGLLKLVVRGEKPHLPLYFALGMDEARVFVTVLLQVLIYCGIGLGAFLGLMLGRMLAASGPGPAGFVINIAVILGVLIAGVYVTLRLSTAAPATIATRKIGVGAAWSAAEDNLGAIFGYWLLWIILAIVLQVATGFFTQPPGYGQAMGDAMLLGDAEQRRAAAERANKIMLSLYNFSDVPNTLRFIGSFVVQTLMSVFTAIAAGVAWRYLNGDEKAEPDDDQPAPTA